MKSDFDQNFKMIARHQTFRTIVICASVLVSVWWMVPVLLAALKR